ncbi:MAG TPA: hypothetical protein PLN93_12560, partial [Vicinamibacterales bacterium]|nr:hypothetical protein [Vicinamibacterales bacterium]
MLKRRLPVLILFFSAVVCLAPVAHAQGTIAPPQFTAHGKTYTVGEITSWRITPNSGTISPCSTGHPTASRSSRSGR